MEFFVRFRAESEKLTYQLSPESIENQSQLVWKEVGWEFRTPIGEAIGVQFFWYKKNKFLAPWLSAQWVPNLSSAVGGNSAATIPLPYGEMKVTYRSKKRYDPKYEGIVLVGHLETVELSFPFGSLAFWNAFAALENHQIVARARVGPPGQTALIQHYLGRAQQVQTPEFARHRNYTWLPRSKEEVAKAELSPRTQDDWQKHTKDAADLQRISGRRLSSFVSPRPIGSPPQLDEEMDNDAWTNERRILPIILRAQDGGIKWQFFNLGTHDAPYVESCYLRWESFATRPGKQGQVETVVTPHLKLRLDFEMSDTIKDQVQITQVRLETRDYASILSVMGRNQGAKTV